MWKRRTEDIFLWGFRRFVNLEVDDDACDRGCDGYQAEREDTEDPSLLG